MPRMKRLPRPVHSRGDPCGRPLGSPAGRMGSLRVLAPLHSQCHSPTKSYHSPHLSSEPVLDIRPYTLEIACSWIRHIGKSSPFGQQHQPGSRTACIKIRTEQALLYAIANDLFKVVLPPFI